VFVHIQPGQDSLPPGTGFCLIVLKRYNYQKGPEIMKLHIRNMVCSACKIVVKNELEKLGAHCNAIELGEIEINGSLTDAQIAEFDRAIRLLGFELMDDKKSYIIEKIKHAIFELVYYSNEELKIGYSDYISLKVNHNYNYLSNLFSEVTGTTIEQYIISRKIERVKELLLFENLSLSEIAFKMNYSSVSHLSSQFKKVTGLTPSYFKQLKVSRIPTPGNL
jgi:AraC-like DNA-binding protein